MTVDSAAGEETSHQSSRGSVPRANAFRVLSLPADAELKTIYRRRDRLLVGIGHGEECVGKQYGLPPLCNVSKEDLNEAVHLLERPGTHLIEELFWVHEMEGLIDGQAHDAIVALRRTAAGNTAQGAVARHNLAVLHTMLGKECAANCKINHLQEGLKAWKALMGDDLFWTFMKARAVKSDGHTLDLPGMKAGACRQLSSMLSDKIIRAVKFTELTVLPILVRIAIEHRSWLELGAVLNFVGQQGIKNGFVSLGAVLDPLSRLTQQDNKAQIRGSLAEREEDLRGVTGTYGDVVRSLGELADADGWDDAVASSYQRISEVYLNLLDDPDDAIRLILQAREHARGLQRLQSVERDRRNIKRAILCRQADGLARSGDFDSAERKLAAALDLCTEDQKTEITFIRDRYRRTRESIEMERQNVQRAILCREAGALVQRGDFAGAEQKLAEALAISGEEHKLEIKKMQDRCRWARVLQGVDTTKKNPVLYRLNGVGATFYGKRDYDSATRSYLTNHWMTFLFFPIFPLGTYRVTDGGDRSYFIHGRTALPDFLKKVRWAIAATAIVLVLAAILGRATSTDAAGASPTNVIAPTQSAGIATKAVAETAGNAPSSEREEIEQERTGLVVLVQSLDDRRRKLDAEEADMQKQERYLSSVRSSYAQESVPAGGESTYEAVSARYHSRVDKYDANVAALKRDFAVYKERVHSLNARIQLLSRSR